MATADRTKVSLRGQQATPLTHTQADANFDELRKVIDDTINLETKVNDLESGASNVITAIQEDIDDITQATNINSAKISSLETSRTSHANRINSLENAMEDVDDELARLDGKIDDNTLGIEQVNNRIDNLPGQVTPPPTNLGATPAADRITVTSSTGGSATLPLATTSTAGLFAPAEKTKLNSMGSMGQRNVTISTSNPSGGADGDIWIEV